MRTVKANRWGNSLGLRLPHFVVESLGIQAGEYLFVRLTDAGDILVRPVMARDTPQGHFSRLSTGGKVEAPRLASVDTEPW